VNDRIAFRDRLEEVSEISTLYFQPPESVKMKYPCIVYSMADVKIQKADNRPYLAHNQYTVTVITKDPDSDVYLKILNGFDHASFDRSFKTDNLNHFVLTIFN
jgi:hypothetical protein